MAALNHDILSADAYNTLPLLDDQTSISKRDLEALASLFIRHGAHRNFAAGLLHRHITLPPDYIMIHHNFVDHSECTIAPAESAAVPHSFYLNDHGSFQAFEYQGPTTQIFVLPPGFVEDLRQELLHRHLESVLSIVPSPSNPIVTEYETLLQDKKGMHTKASARVPGEGEEHISTTWVFSEGEKGDIIITEAKKCVKMINGVHEVRKD